MGRLNNRPAIRVVRRVRAHTSGSRANDSVGNGDPAGLVRRILILAHVCDNLDASTPTSNAPRAIDRNCGRFLNHWMELA